MTGGPIVIFDAECVFCSGTIRFIYRHDASGELRFAAMQSPSGRALLRRHGLPLANPESFYILTAGGVLSQSAALRFLAARLTWPFRFLVLATRIPSPFVDRLYALIARNRYRIAGRRVTCQTPPVEDHWRFLK
jgi:predicted DCC family thiol-disulfide oxidoreductase YuxK